jgi:small subunit ribosomal protein S20
MPNIKSAIKRQETEQRDRARNKSQKSELATALKKINVLLKNGDKVEAEKLVPATFSILDEMVTKGIIHKNKADRNKANISKKLAKLA